MDAVKFVEGYDRMCCYYTCCYECPLNDKHCAMEDIAPGDAEKIVAIVEKWMEEHPEGTT